MVTASTSEFKGGLKIMLDGAPCNIIDHEFVKPGKGQAFTRVKYKNLLTGRTLEKTFKSGESVELADINELDMQYLYADGAYWHFMCEQTFEQYTVDAQVIADIQPWLKEQMTCLVTLWNDDVIAVQLPKFVDLQVSHSEPGAKGDTVSGATKSATLETGAVVQVPLFVQEGEVIRIDTRTGKYDSRVKT